VCTMRSVLFVASISIIATHSFTFDSHAAFRRSVRLPLRRSSSPRDESESMFAASDENTVLISEEEIIANVAKPQLVMLCKKMGLSTSGNKMDLFCRMKGHVELLEAKNFDSDVLDLTKVKKRATEHGMTGMTGMTERSTSESTSTTTMVYSTQSQNDQTPAISSENEPTLETKTVGGYDLEIDKGGSTNEDKLSTGSTYSTDSTGKVGSGGVDLFEGSKDPTTQKHISECGTLLASLMSLPLPFMPSSIQPSLLSRYAESMLWLSGDCLEEAIRNEEMEAIAADGLAGDNVEEGGGNYNNLQRVAAFLRGYRKGEADKVSRGNVKMLLNVVRKRGVVGLDEVLEGIGNENLGGVSFLSEDIVRYISELSEAKRKEIEQVKKTAGDENSADGIQEKENVVRLLEVLKERIRVESMRVTYRRGVGKGRGTDAEELDREVSRRSRI